MALSKHSLGIVFKVFLVGILTVSFLVGVGIIIWKYYPWNINSDDLAPEQQLMLAKIKVEGEEAGLEKSALDKITKFNETVCYTDECLESALEFLSAINLTVNPCNPDSWLDFVCARRARGTDNFSQLKRLQEIAKEQTLEMLETDLKNPTADEYLFQEAQAYYNQCVNKGGDDKANILDILKYTEKLGGWPLFSYETPPRNYSWMKLVAVQNRVEKPGFKPLFFSVTSTRSNITQIQLDIGRLSFLENEQRLLHFQNYIEIIGRITTYGGLDTPADIEQIQLALVELEGFKRSLQLFNNRNQVHRQVLSLSQLEYRTKIYFEQRNARIRVNFWGDFFERVFARSGIKMRRKTSPKISLQLEPVMRLVFLVEQQMSLAEARIRIVNALQINLATMLLAETTSLGDGLRAFQTTEEEGSRADMCLKRVTDAFGYSLGATYLNWYHDSSIEPNVLDLMDDIKEGYMSIIRSPPWMEGPMAPGTEQFLMDKVDSIETRIAHPAWARERSSLESFYKGLNISLSENSSYVHNFLELSRWRVAKTWSWIHLLSEIGTDHDSDESAINIAIAGLAGRDVYMGQARAEYNIAINVVDIQAGVLRSPLFNVNLPGFMYYGGLGTILGHEIGHSLTDGRKYDKFGDDSEEHWDPTSLEKYEKWAQNISAFYDNIPYNITTKVAISLKGKWNLLTNESVTTTNEDLADILGLRAAFIAYRGQLEELEKAGEMEMVLPGLGSFSTAQLFFMKYAIMWCQELDVQSRMKEAYYVGEHSPSSRRADLPLRLSEDFQNAFHCTQKTV